MGNSISTSSSSTEEMETIHSHHKRSAELLGMSSNQTTLLPSSPDPELSDEALICLYWDPTNVTSHQLYNGDEILDIESFKAGSKDIHESMRTQQQNGMNYCKRDWDGVLCWPETPEGYSATLQCFDNLNGIKYDSSKTVSKYCEPGGIWQNVTDYGPCVPITTNATNEADEGLGITIHVYFFGYSLSLVALVFAMIILLAFNFLCLKAKRDDAGWCWYVWYGKPYQSVISQ